MQPKPQILGFWLDLVLLLDCGSKNKRTQWLMSVSSGDFHLGWLDLCWGDHRETFFCFPATKGQAVFMLLCLIFLPSGIDPVLSGLLLLSHLLFFSLNHFHFVINCRSLWSISLFNYFTKEKFLCRVFLLPLVLAKLTICYCPKVWVIYISLLLHMKFHLPKMVIHFVHGWFLLLFQILLSYHYLQRNLSCPLDLNQVPDIALSTLYLGSSFYFSRYIVSAILFFHTLHHHLISHHWILVFFSFFYCLCQAWSLMLSRYKTHDRWINWMGT